MSTGPINTLSNSYLQSILSTALQNAGSTADKTGNSLSGIDASSLATDKSQLSPFAQLMITLQQLQQSDPTKYEQVTQQIATNLQTAAQTALSEGNTTAANRLNQLATDFTNASKSGQLPNIQDLAQAIGGHHHHHHSHAASADSSGTSQLPDQILAAFQTSGTQNDSLNPMAIIFNTLSSSGISVSNA
jgi:hypothetical protein